MQQKKDRNFVIKEKRKPQIVLFKKFINGIDIEIFQNLTLNFLIGKVVNCNWILFLINNSRFVSINNILINLFHLLCNQLSIIQFIQLKKWPLDGTGARSTATTKKLPLLFLLVQLLFCQSNNNDKKRVFFYCEWLSSLILQHFSRFQTE